jgi:predicted transcriptional regulator of viral defense system
MTATEASVSREQRLFDVADRQAGYFTAAQARLAGYSHRQLTYYVRSVRFARVRPRVYRLVLYPSSPNEDLYVAWLQAGASAVISHDSALAVHDLSDALPAEMHLTIPRNASRRRPGLVLHTSHLERSEVTEVGGLPVTTAPRTIADMAAAGLAEEQVVQAVSQAVHRGLVSVVDLRAYAAKRGGRALRLISRALEE